MPKLTPEGPESELRFFMALKMTFRAPLVTATGASLVILFEGTLSVEVSMAPSGCRAVCLVVH